MIAPLPNEPERAFALFKAYVEMGPQRSIRKAVKKLGVSFERLKQASVKWQWQVRIREHLIQNEEANARADDQAKLEASRQREAFRAEIDQHERDAFRLIVKKVKELEMLPVIRRVGKDYAKYPDGSYIEDRDGNKVPQTIIYNPINASIMDIAKMSQLASMLGRINQGMPTGRQEITGAGGEALAPAVPAVINVVHQFDEQSKEVDRIQQEFIAAHPNDPAVIGHNGKRNGQ